MKYRILFIAIVISLFGMKEVRAQGWTVKTNLAGWAALAPNVGVDLCMNECSSIEAIFYKSAANCWMKKANFTALQLGYKYWFDRTPLNSFFLGVTATPARYKLEIKDTQRKGDCIPFGVNMGYCYPLSDRMNIEFSYGIGATYLFEDITATSLEVQQDAWSRRKFAFTPVNFGINISYIIK